MKRKDSFLVEVNVGEDEAEDIAVRKYMKAVMDTGVINELRSRKTKEPKKDKYKRELKNRIEAHRNGVRQPTWPEIHYDQPVLMEPGPFNDLYRDPEGYDFNIDLTGPEGAQGMFNPVATQSEWGGYNQQNYQGGYQQADSSYNRYNSADLGGYQNDPAGGYAVVGGYNPDTGGYITK